MNDTIIGLLVIYSIVNFLGSIVLVSDLQETIETIVEHGLKVKHIALILLFLPAIFLIGVTGLAFYIVLKVSEKISISKFLNYTIYKRKN